MNTISNQRGIALLIVLSALLILSTAILELNFYSRINYKLAVNAKERLKAFYLAKSALNLSHMVLKYNKEAESLLNQAKQNNIQGLDIEPLYKQIPLSSSLFRGIMEGSVDLDSLGGGEEGKDEEGAGEEKKAVEKEEAPAPKEGEGSSKADGEAGSPTDAGVSMLDREAAEKFLDFDGDFDAEITEEQTKYNINRVFGLETSSKTYDNMKKMLASILALPQFKEPLQKANAPPDKLTHIISDWVDLNGVINEYENVQRGGEDGLYSDFDYQAKNGKFLSVSELKLLPDMNDELFTLLKPLVTVYSASEKINACLAAKDIAKALVYHFTHNAGCTPPVEYEDEDKMEEYVTQLLGGCPDPNQMASGLMSFLGLADLAGATPPAQPESPNPDNPNPATPPPPPPQGAANGCAFQIKDWLTNENNVFQVKSTGTVGDTSVVITAVVNTKEKSPKQWKYFYYRVE